MRSGPTGISPAFYSEVDFLVFVSEYLYTNSLVLMAEAYVVIQHEQIATGSCGTLTCGELSGVPSLWSLSESPSASMIYCRESARGSVLTVT